MMDSKNPWDKQPGEGSEAFAAFCLYRDLGPGRSKKRVAEQLSKSVSLIGRWMTKHHWYARASAWDLHLDAVSQAQAADEVAELRRQELRVRRKTLDKVEVKLDSMTGEEIRPSDLPSYMRASMERAGDRDKSQGLTWGQMEEISRGILAMIWEIREMLDENLRPKADEVVFTGFDRIFGPELAGRLPPASDIDADPRNRVG
jgi:hypothetical protein